MNFSNFLKSKEYIKALKQKMTHIQFAKSNISRNPLEELFKKGLDNGTNSINFFSPDADKLFLTEQILIEYSIITANSFFDILLQIINSELFHHKSILEGSITRNVITKNLEENNTFQKISDELESLEKSDSYIYIRDFTNKVKHRNIVKQKSVIRIDDKSGPVVDEFTHNNRCHKSKNWLQVFETIEDLKLNIYKCIDKVDEKIRD